MAGVALILFILTIVTSFGSTVHAGDKSRYTIFNPTPVAEMREFATDRPDKTESAHSVDAGHVQFETDVYYLSADKDEDGARTTSHTLNFINLKVGLTNNVDTHLIVETFTKVTTQAPGEPQTEKQGFGDLTYRIKYTLFGNDEGPVTFALMPFVKIPTNSGHLSNKKLEGGLVAVFALELPRETKAGVQFQYNRSANEVGPDLHNELATSVTIGHGLYKKLEGYVELYSLASNEPAAAWVATFDAGLTYMAWPNTQFDVGVNTGLTEAADDFSPFLGLSMRF